MKNQDYNRKTLSKFFYRAEISSFSNKEDKKVVIDTAINNIYEKVVDNLHITKRNNKISFYSDNLSFKILYRKITRDLLSKYGDEVKTPSRNRLVKGLLAILRENFPYKIFKLDVAGFYENFDKHELICNINNFSGISPYSKRFILSILEFCHKEAKLRYPEISVSLPRGINFSGVVANILMRDFDSYLNNNSDVFYYSRFVDDIIIISNEEVDEKIFVKEIKENFYKGLFLNNGKKTICRSNEVINIDYLGYNINNLNCNNELEEIGTIFKSKGKYRKLNVTISSKKINKIKNRICRSFIGYIKDRDDRLLIDRIKFLASNKHIIDKKTLKKRINGIRYSYPSLTNESSLDNLDKFVYFLLYSGKSRLSRLLKDNLSTELKKKITCLSFKKFYNDKVFFSFSPSKIIKIQECWKYE